MRSCGRTDELRATAAAEEELSPSLAAHVAACTECATAWAAARRFESGLDAALGELVTDALPPTTVVASRSAPRASGGPRWTGVALGALATTALAAFAAIGVLNVVGSAFDTVGGRLGGGPAPADQATDTVDCHLGDATVDVTVEEIGAADARTSIAYCIGNPIVIDSRAAAERENAITCVRSVERAGSGPVVLDVREVDRDGYLGACTHLRDVEPVPDAGDLIPAPSRPFGSWDAAVEAVGWPVLVPQWLPKGYELAALQGFGVPTDPSAIDSVVANYLRNGTLLTIDQFAIHDPATFSIELTIPGDALGDVATGQTVVGDSPAFWAQGVVEFTSGGPNLNVETLVLTWSDGEVGYRIASRSDDLETLRRIGEALGKG
jgi:hypothetical protein